MCEVKASLGRPVPLEVRLTRNQQQFKDNTVNAPLAIRETGEMDLSVWELQRGDDQAKVHHTGLSVRLALLILIGHNIHLTSCFWMFAANLVHAL